ncbi:MAG: cytochrome c biogenesis heme-transporting ATPase CcmA [Immundisolibacteraceae bacterium]|nr:cytochrome c biogenesis heme-transporting ATPase CcmA [Immundisolibacteraceae bacterium]
MKPSLAVANLSAIRGERLLFSDLNFELESGQSLRISGANGSGKTTLLRMLAGLTAPAQGTVLWNSENILQCREQFQSQIAYSGHQFGLSSDLTTLENLRYLIPNPPSENKLIEILARLELKASVDLPARYLSQGQRRRLILARLLAMQVCCWILDEPLAALDTAGIELVEQICTEHTRQGGMLVITSHQKLSATLGDVPTLALGGSTA